MSKKEIFDEIESILLNSEKPSEGIKKLIKENKLNQEPFNMITKLEKIEQNPKYHPEGNVLNHVLMVVDEASKRKNSSLDKKSFMWAALLHDIGKSTTTRVRKNKITSYNHDIEGEKMSNKFLDMVSDDTDFKNKVSKLVRYHMQPLFYDKNLPFFEPKSMLEEVDYEELSNLSKCDRLGRGSIGIEDIEKEEEKIDKFKQYCKIKVYKI